MFVNIKQKNRQMAVLFLLYYFASGAIAPTGQIDAHVPQEIHLLGSITHLPSGPVEIAITGHIPIHV